MLHRPTVYVFAVIALLLASIVPTIVSAATVTQRSIALSNSSVSATNVTYDVDFTSVGSAAAFVIDFCSNSPVIGLACTDPSVTGGFSAASVASTTPGFTNVEDLDANTVLVTGTVAAASNISVELTGITNPNTAGPLYARIVTYSDAGDAALYTSENLGDSVVDQGSVAISITPTIGVSGAVLETMTFCIAGELIAKDCDTSGNTPPVVALGETVGDTVALVSTDVSVGSIFTQISTNAVGGAVVSLKSNTVDCGGLIRAGAPEACDIAPALDDDIEPGDARFGVKTTDATDSPDSDAIGDFQPVALSNYSNSIFALNYAAGNATGVTSTYGDPFLDTNNAPVNNKNMELIFGASVSNSTPAGQYSAILSLIATGKF